ncbi:auxin response factor 13-like [Phragmites australis]|uniref:auxin response factor 13-like n=1 Tax=Phragmites australis TaxID=29695 RepID=UPI002D77B8D5|nr:auxin response factor 13-like [Phragmites australis]
MAQPPAADPDPIVDRHVWLACAVPLSRLPAVGSQVYYFPHGHAEQCPAHLPDPLPGPHLFPCTVTAIRFGADVKTNEVFAAISLQPGPHRGTPAPPSDPDLDPQPQQQQQRPFGYFAKQLTQSDANNGGGFSVPRYCADHIFPVLDFEADPPVQNLLMRDPKGKTWQFRHIYRGTPRRHLLTTGWSKFVNAKLLVAGDTVVFMRRPNGDLVIGLRRVPRYPVASAAQAQAPPPRNARARVPPEDVVEAARLAAEGSPFTVAYYPRQGAGEFVVPRKEVEDALATRWEPGMQVRMQVMEAEDARRTDWANGTVKALHPSIWRALEIEWDDPTPSSSTKSRYVNVWQVQLVGYPPLMKRLRFSDTIGDDPMAAPLIGPESQEMAILLGAPIPASMQGARHSGPTDVPSSSSAMITTQQLFPMDPQMPPSLSGGSSEILDPEIGSPPNNSVNMHPSNLPVEAKSIQLFGTTITPHVEQSATDGASEEVNEVPNGVVDENVEGDV